MAQAMVPQERLFELVGYLKTMSARMKALQENVSAMEQKIAGFGLLVLQKKDCLLGNVSDTRLEVQKAKDSVRFLQKNTLLVIGELKKAVKKEEFERIEKRLDIWGPEKLISREEAKRVLGRKG